MSHTPGPMEAARRQWWYGLSKQGDPMRIVDPLSAGFRAGWEASGSINADLLNALKIALPIVESEHDTGERSWLPNPNPEEARSLELSADALKAMRAAIAKATGGDL